MSTINGSEAADVLLGTEQGDNISGNGGDDTIIALEGDDTLRGGAGNDILDGGPGDGDQVRYDRVFEPIGVDLAAGRAADGRGGTDSLLSIEDIRGSQFADTIAGSDADNQILGGGDADLILGGAGDDDLAGESGDDTSDTLAGLAGDDTIEGGPGDDRIDGDDGVDTALYDGAFADYILTLSPDGVTVADKRDGGTGTDRLSDMELLRFADGAGFVAEDAVDLTALTGVADLVPSDLARLCALYVANFDRAPDALGLGYWGTRLSDGMAMEDIARSFSVQTEFTSLYGSLEDVGAFVDAAYANLLEREADAEGRAYWVETLESGALDAGTFILAFIDGARGNPEATADVRTIEAKTGIALRFAAEQGLNDTDAAAEVMARYAADDPVDSLAAALDLVDTYRAVAEAPDGTDPIVEIAGSAAGSADLV